MLKSSWKMETSMVANFNPPVYSCLHSMQLRTNNVIPHTTEIELFLWPEYKKVLPYIGQQKKIK